MAKKVTHTLLAKYFTGNCSHEEKLAVETWRELNTSNRAEYEQYRAIWEHSVSDKEQFNPDTEKALQNVNLALGPENGETTRNRTFFPKTLLRIAAVLVLGVFGWLTYYYLSKPVEPQLLIATTKGNTTEILLSDGTHVWLNKNSEFRYPEKFTSHNRQVYLNGEAYFEVARDTAHPFIIESAATTVKVLGTKFNVRVRESEITATVSVTEGKVAFTGTKVTETQSVILQAGQYGTYLATKKQMISGESSNSNFMAWKTGKLVFRETPLSQVVNDLSGYYNRTVKVDSAKSDIPFTGTFSKQSLSEVLMVLEASLQVKADTSQTEVNIR